MTGVYGWDPCDHIIPLIWQHPGSVMGTSQYMDINGCYINAFDPMLPYMDGISIYRPELYIPIYGTSQLIWILMDGI
jgi:hypothetical protein